MPTLALSRSGFFLVWRVCRRFGTGLNSLTLSRIPDTRLALLLFFFFCLLGEFSLAFCKVVIWLYQWDVLSG